VTLTRYSEPYLPTGGLAAEGVINQLGRPDIEPLEVLVREAVQNCWDARRETEPCIRVEIARRELDARAVSSVAQEILVDPPPDLTLAEQLRPGMAILHFADFGTAGLAGPTRADRVTDSEPRDFVDFVRNIGQPPDKELGGGSFGYGKAAFYIASRARTIVIDTLCETDEGPQRRLIAAALGSNHSQEGRAHTGRHWWGAMIDGVPEPVTGDEAERVARLLGLPERSGREGLGTTIAIIAPGIELDGDGATMPFIAEAILWNFWPKMLSTPGGVQATIDFRLHDNGVRVAVPDPRLHRQLRGFAEAMDRLRIDPLDDDDDPTVIDRSIASMRPIRHLGRLVIQRGPVAPVAIAEVRALTRGERATASGIHHVALMRNAELVVRYLPGPESTTGRVGYAGVFRCSVDTDTAFRSAEPPTHDDWVVRAVPDRRERVYVNVALDRIRHACREAAGYGSGHGAATAGADIPLGEFADGLARLMPGFEGTGARRATPTRSATRRRNAPGSRSTTPASPEIWISEPPPAPGGGAGDTSTSHDVIAPHAPSPHPPPQIRPDGDPGPAITRGGSPVMRYPFRLRARGNQIRLSAAIRVMTNDGESVESDPPLGWIAPEPCAWIDPAGIEHRSATIEPPDESTDGPWVVEIPIVDDMVLGIDITPTVIA
jgi:hypothetical protein